MIKLSGQIAYRRTTVANTTLKFRKGEIIYAQGDPATDWYQIISGTVRTCLLYPDGHRQLTGFYYSGDVFGIDADTYRSSAEAVAAAVLRRCGRGFAAPDTPDEVGNASSLLQGALSHAQACISLLGRRTAHERVAAFLLATARRIGGSNSLRLPMTRADIADHLALTIHTVSRTLSELARRGVIALDGPQSIAILNPAQLRLLADGDEDDRLGRQRTTAAALGGPVATSVPAVLCGS